MDASIRNKEPIAVPWAHPAIPGRMKCILRY